MIGLLDQLPDHISTFFSAKLAIFVDPPNFSLDIDLDDVISLSEDTIDTLKEAILPEDIKDCAAIVLSEFAAGAIGGIAGKETAVLDGNKNNKDNFLVSAESSGLFFAIRGGFNAGAQLLGVTTSLVSIIALVLATFVSEEFKIFARGTGSSKASAVEVAADVAKWVTYDVSMPMDASFSAAIGCGALAGIMSQLLRESGGDFGGPLLTVTDIKQKPLMRIVKAGIEGSAQFLTYEAARQWLLPIIPVIPFSPNFNPQSLLGSIGG